MSTRYCRGMLAALAVALSLAGAGAARSAALPAYAHVFVILEENQGLAEIMDKPFTPNITRLARQYGIATHYYGIVHPSEGNYVAMLAGDNAGIHDDDAYFCRPGATQPECRNAASPGYPDHTVRTPTLVDQLAQRGLSWKGYFESLPKAGAGDVTWPAAGNAGHLPAALYASKHNGFMNLAVVQNDPARAAHIVDFAALDADLASGDLPSFAHIVPNQCNEMHGLNGPDVPVDCAKDNMRGRIARGDAMVGRLTAAIMHSAIWSEPGNSAIVITFDESGHITQPGDPQGCCGYAPHSLANFGGGRIPTIVITNHGPRGLQDPTPYNHYSLLRTIEDGFGITTHIGHAADREQGVVAMTKLFATSR